MSGQPSPSSCWWIDETPPAGPRQECVLYFGFPKGEVNVGDLYLNESSELLYRRQKREYKNGGKRKILVDWFMVAEGVERINSYLDLFYYA